LKNQTEIAGFPFEKEFEECKNEASMYDIKRVAERL